MTSARESADRASISVALTDRQPSDQQCRGLMDEKYFGSKSCRRKVGMCLRSAAEWMKGKVEVERQSGGCWVLNGSSTLNPQTFDKDQTQTQMLNGDQAL